MRPLARFPGSSTIEVAVRAANDLGDRATGSVVVSPTIPRAPSNAAQAKTRSFRSTGPSPRGDFRPNAIAETKRMMAATGLRPLARLV